MDKVKKVIATVVTASMLVSVGAPVFAADTNTAVNYKMASTRLETENNMVGLDQYMSYNEDKTIAFNAAAALAAGYDVNAVEAISSNISSMNQMVLAGTAVPSKNFSITKSFASVKAAGQSKIVTHWDGRVEYYLNSTEAAALQRNLKVGYSIADAAAKALSAVGGSTPLSAMGGIVSVYTSAMRSQIEIAISHGTGIIMTTQPESSTGILYVWFSYQ